jgi:thioester reductase-like protein
VPWLARHDLRLANEKARVSGAVLLTGGTGFLGMELLARLLAAEEGPEIVLAIRACSDADAEGRLSATLARLFEERPPSARRLRALPADLTEVGLGISGAQRAALASTVERVVHCGGLSWCGSARADARAVNVHGTRRMIDLARTLPRLQRFVHVSTVFVSGRYSGVFRESDVGGVNFRNAYEWSKLEAEVAVVMARDIPSVIVRPSILVGESDSGWTAGLNVAYWPLRAIAQGQLARIPATAHGIVDIVPVDYVAAVVERVLFAPAAAGRFHAVAGESALTVEKLLTEVSRQLQVTPPALVPPGAVSADPPVSVFAPYLDAATRFDDSRARLLMTGGAPDPVEYLPRLSEFARVAEWGKRPLSREMARALVGLPTG